MRAAFSHKNVLIWIIKEKKKIKNIFSAEEMSKIEKSRPEQVIVFEPDTGVHFIWFVRVFGGNFQFNRNG